MRRGVRIEGIKLVVKANGRRYLYRRVAGQLVPLPDLPENDPRFLEAYVKAGSVQPKPKGTAKAGTIAAAIALYLGSSEYHILAPSTRAVVRRTLDRINQKAGQAMLADLSAKHLNLDLGALTPGSASNRLKAWRGLLKFAVSRGLIEANPSVGVAPPRGKVRPHRQWTRPEIEQFRAHWASGTPERLTFEVLLWTGARCSDAVTLGWQFVSDGWLTFTQKKTGGPATCPVHSLPRWARGLADDHAAFLAELPNDRMLWIATRTGGPRSVKALSQWISAAASAAGLPNDCTAHGLRKARAAALAESRASTHQIGAWTGHRSLSEISHYTRAADQRAILGEEREQNMGNRIAKFPNPGGK